MASGSQSTVGQAKICLCFSLAHSTFPWTSLLSGKRAALSEILPLSHPLPTYQHIQAGTHSTTILFLEEERERRGRYNAQGILRGATPGASSKTRDLRRANGRRENILQVQNMRYATEKPMQRKVLPCPRPCPEGSSSSGNPLGRLTWNQLPSAMVGPLACPDQHTFLHHDPHKRPHV